MAKRMSLAALDSMPLAELQGVWTQLYGSTSPSLSPDLLRRGLAYRLQEKKFGKLDRRIATYLARYRSENVPDTAKPILGSKLSIGTKLVRDWHGVGYSVTVLEDGFEYRGEHWKSLTAIARAITGVKWSGPRFFGLVAKGKAA